MKKALVILFALGLVFSFSAPVMATDVSFDGSMRVRGWYDSNSALAENNTSNAYYDQRFRLQGVFQVAEGLKVNVRGDVLDGTWGTAGMRGSTTVAALPTTVPTNNVQFDMAYMTFMTAIGQFQAGYMSDGTWGTGFGDLEVFLGKITFLTKLGENIYVYLNTTKISEGDNGTAYSDQDYDGYVAALMYKSEGIDSGLLYKYARNANDPAGLAPALESLQTANILVPYVKATFGDLYVEAELSWLDGEVVNRAGGAKLLDVEGLTYYLMAKYNLGSAYVGGLFAYVQGDDPNTPAVTENALNSGGDWDPMLILFNDTCPTALGNVAGSTTGTSLTNGYIYQAFAGTTIDKLSLKASLSAAKADETAAGFDNDYGTEFDLEASYKIYDNLTYSAGFGYLWAGDYYKGLLTAGNKIDDTYLLMNKLQVNF